MSRDLNKKAASPRSVLHTSVKSDFILKKGVLA